MNNYLSKGSDSANWNLRVFWEDIKTFQIDIITVFYEKDIILKAIVFHISILFFESNLKQKVGLKTHRWLEVAST